jgi:hypothetical protein
MQALPDDVPWQIQKPPGIINQGILAEGEFQQKKKELLAKM